MIKAGVIEPWDDYIPKDVLDDMIPSIRAEGTIDGKLYGWPFLLDVIGNSWHSGLTTKAGLADKAPDDLGRASCAMPRPIVDLQAAPFGAAFDDRGWRSLAPMTHSMSTNVYTPEGLFDFDERRGHRGPEADEEDHCDVDPDSCSKAPPTAASTARRTKSPSPPSAWATTPSTSMRRCAWPSTGTIPRRCASGPLPKFANGEGSTVFWTTGCALFKYGKNKEKAAEYIKALTYDMQIWQDFDRRHGERPSRPAAALQVDLRRLGCEQAGMDAGIRRRSSAASSTAPRPSTTISSASSSS